LTKKITNLSDRHLVYESTIRGFESNVAAVETELKSVERLFLDTKDSQLSIFARAVADFEVRHKSLGERLTENNEKVINALKHIDNTKE
jgi:hypothetical protein